MPTITINLKDLAQLLGCRSVSATQVEAWLPLVKGELKDYDDGTDELRIELQDGNRPDLWSCEGIARQIRTMLAGKASAYPCFRPRRPRKRLLVSPGLETIRPFVAACAAIGYRLTTDGLAQLIQTQEKLADIFGRKRRTVSIGLYRLSPIVFPVTYMLAHPDEVRFTPLGFDEPISAREILSIHPKGVEYGPILAGHDLIPLLRDAEGKILSLPPVINSREIGEILVGDAEFFVEVTGTDLFMVLLTLNILAVNLADRGATIEPVEVIYPCMTPLGKTVRTPLDFARERAIPVSTIETTLGLSLGAASIARALRAYGYRVKPSRQTIIVKPPPFRNDCMHPVDVIEDVAISWGYDQFAPVLPAQFTIGGLSRAEQISDRIRELMVGMGFQEVMSNILASRYDLCDRMRLGSTPWSRVVEIENTISQNYSCLRQWIIPSLLRVESASTQAFYPHRLFEVGEIAVPDCTDEHGARTVLSLGALIAHAGAHFSEMHSCLDLLLFYLDVPYTLEPVTHPSFLEGRVGRILTGNSELGMIGELHPEVLEHWQTGVPCVVLELEVDRLAGSR
jgi:phenylalanyl-tRNA synthetase beta chain